MDKKFQNRHKTVDRDLVYKLACIQCSDQEIAEVVGITARIVQHEIDHLDGVTMFQRANGYHKTKALKERENHLRNIRNENS